MTLHPPKPALTVRIGVVGHRWDRLVPDDGRAPADRLAEAAGLEGRLTTPTTAVLAQVAARVRAIAADPACGYAQGAPGRIAVISGLAEGADRIAARAALDLGLELWSVLPFEAAVYRRDFDGQWAAPLWSRPGAAEEFSELLGRSTTTMEMDGPSNNPATAYEPLGRAVLAHSDILLAIWDGREGRGAGGTPELVAAARRQDIPVVRIDPASPHACWLEDTREPDLGRSVGLERLDRRLGDLFEPPEVSELGPPGAARGRLDFQAEVMISGRFLGKSYGALTGFFGNRHSWLGQAFAPSAFAWLGAIVRIFRPSLPPDYVAATVSEWKARWADDAAAGPGPAVIDGLAPIHGWLDHLARAYADRYRSAFTIIFSLAWMATVAAVLGLAAGIHHSPMAHVWGWVEVALLVGILGLTVWGKRQRFHEKWIDYRLLAEQVRHLTFLWPVAAASAGGRLPMRPSADDPRTAWTGWFYRAWVRHLGLPTRTMGAAHLAWCQRTLRDREIPAQRVYHDNAADRYRHLHHVVHTRTEALFGAALILAVLHLNESAVHAIGSLIGLPESWAGPALSVLAVFMPARAAALHGWAGHADFRASALRSAQIELKLEQLERELEAVPSPSSAALGKVGLAAAQAMEGELGAWRATSLSRPLQRV